MVDTKQDEVKKDGGELTVSQRQELEEWVKKINSGEAYSETKDIISKITNGFYDPEENLREIIRRILPKMRIKKQKANDKDMEIMIRAMRDFGLENNITMLESIEIRYRGMTINLRKNLIKEFNCTTYTEKSLVDLAVGAFARNLSYSKKLFNIASIGHINKELNNFMSIMSKEIDRANRHYLTALETLKQLKQPELNINVKAKTAFISQNQQFNNNQNETIEAK